MRQKKQLKILLVTEYYPPVIKGGGEINIEMIAKSLSAKSMDIYVLTSTSPNLPIEEVIGGIKIFRSLSTGNNPSSIIDNFKRSAYLPQSLKKSIMALNSDYDFDIIHFIGTTLIAASSLQNIRAKLFATVESYPSLCPKGDRYYMSQTDCKLICDFPKYIHCQSKCKEIGKMKNSAIIKYNLPLLTYIYSFHKKLNKSLKYVHLVSISEYIKSILELHGHKSKVIPNIIDVKRFNDAAKLSTKKNSMLTTHEKRLKISYFGTLSDYKGPMVILKSVLGLNVRVDLYGNGPLKDSLNNFINLNKIDAEIHDHIPYEKVPKKYAESDVIIFPSLWPEPFGRISIEGIAAGKIVIGSRIGGIAETLVDRGIFFEPGNVGELRSILEKIIHDRKKYFPKKIDINKLQEKYSQETIANKLIDYYLEIANF